MLKLQFLFTDVLLLCCIFHVLCLRQKCRTLLDKLLILIYPRCQEETFSFSLSRSHSYQEKACSLKLWHSQSYNTETQLLFSNKHRQTIRLRLSRRHFVQQTRSGYCRRQFQASRPLYNSADVIITQTMHCAFGLLLTHWPERRRRRRRAIYDISITTERERCRLVKTCLVSIDILTALLEFLNHLSIIEKVQTVWFSLWKRRKK